MNEEVLSVRQKVEKLTSWVNFNYIGLTAAVLSVIVTMYNINKYWEDIKKAKRGM